MSTPSSQSTYCSVDSAAAATSNDAAAKSRRVHTDAQLHRKRQVDKLKQKSNRYENKRRMEKLESDVSRLLSAVEDMSRQLRRIPTLAAAAAEPPSPMYSYSGRPPSPVNGLSAGMLGMHVGSNPQSSSSSSSTSVPTCHDRPGSARPLTPCLEQSEMEDVKPSPSQLLLHLGTPAGEEPEEAPNLASGPPYIPVECRCGVEHQSPFDCIEYASYVMLYQAHLGLARDPLQAPPRLHLNPPLINMMLLAPGGDPVVFFATAVCRQFELADIQTLFGLYLITYRFLRWRLYPDPASLGDVPDWLRPTEIQQSCPHSLSLDYIPWPALRDWLCLNQPNDHRHTVDMYTRSLRLRWPVTQPLILPDSQEGVVLNSGFVDFALDIRNWQLGSPWADEFPHLVSYVT